MDFYKYLPQEERRKVLGILMRRMPIATLAKSLAVTVIELYNMRDGYIDIDDDTFRTLLYLLSDEEKMMLALDIIPDLENALNEAKRFFKYAEVLKIISSVHE